MKHKSTLQKPSVPVRLVRSAKRALYWRISSVLPIILAAEFPKSGGTWIANMVAMAAGYRFPRNNLPPHFSKTVLLGHYKRSALFHNVFVIFRDGRDVMVSAYHHFLFENEWNDPRTVANVRKVIGFRSGDHAYARFNEFVEWMFTGYSNGFMRSSWSEFARSWLDADVPTVFYEKMLDDPNSELKRLCDVLNIQANASRIEEIVQENSFERQTGRPRGIGATTSAAPFARKGIAGDWKNVFDKDSMKLFDHYAGRELVALGYEPDRSWAG